jgi:hypothetical protein
MPSRARRNAEQVVNDSALHGFNVNSKGQLVYTKQTLHDASVRAQDEDGNELFEQYHVGPAGMRYLINNRGKFVVRIDG